MRTLNDYKIILNKGKTKPKIFFFLTLNQAMICLILGIITYKLFAIFMSELFSLILGIGVCIAIAALFIEIPADHLSVLEHLKIAYQYYFKETHQYYYYRTSKKIIDTEIIEDTAPVQPEARYKAVKKKRKVKK
ncbi:PrgI family protein [[Clostridium] spiroforme]|nr:PrgI family protein [Thomasclavelia spiroformis]